MNRKSGNVQKWHKRDNTKEQFIDSKPKSDIKREIHKETKAKDSKKDLHELQNDNKEVQRHLKKDSKELKKFSIHTTSSTHNDVDSYNSRHKIIKMYV